MSTDRWDLAKAPAAVRDPTGGPSQAQPCGGGDQGPPGRAATVLIQVAAGPGDDPGCRRGLWLRRWLWRWRRAGRQVEVVRAARLEGEGAGRVAANLEGDGGPVGATAGLSRAVLHLDHVAGLLIDRGLPADVAADERLDRRAHCSGIPVHGDRPGKGVRG